MGLRPALMLVLVFMGFSLVSVFVGYARIQSNRRANLG